MKQTAIRTSIDIPRDLHRKLHEAAARKGCSARKLILAGIERAVDEAGPSRPKRRLDLSIPLIPPAGRHIDPTNEELYDLRLPVAGGIRRIATSPFAGSRSWDCYAS